MRKQLMILTVAALVFGAVQAFGQGASAAGTNTVSATLAINVTVQKAVRLSLSGGTVGTTPCTMNNPSAGSYNVSLGNIDALAVEAPTCGKSYAPTTPGTTNSLYYTDYQLIPIFTSQSPTVSPTITAYVSSNFAKATLSVLQATSDTGLAAYSAMSILSASPTTVVTGATSTTSYQRFVGVSVAPTNGASLTGADSATITYTLTVT
jgi:hypothetical protein